MSLLLWKKLTSILLTVIGTGVMIWTVRKTFHILPGKTSKRRPIRRSLEDLEKVSWEKVGKIKSVWIYPVKSCAGVSVQKAQIRREGPYLGKCIDRSFMIMDKKGQMITARKITAAVKITPHVDDEKNCITLTYCNLDPLTIKLDYPESEGIVQKTKIWNDDVAGFDCGDEAADWLSNALNCKCRLLYHGSVPSLRSTAHLMENKTGLMNADDNSLYADSHPCMLMSEASLKDLESRTGHHHPFQNFRPNLLVENEVPYDEDSWTYIKIGNVVFRNIVNCSRCTFPTINYKTGERDPNMEPFRTLKKYRCPPNSTDPDFGIQLGVDKDGEVCVGDDVFAIRN